MRLVNAKQMIRDAKENKYAIAAFNINNLEWIKAILEMCNENRAPVILETSESAVKYMGGYKNVHDMVLNIGDHLGITIPVCLHLDHGTYEGAFKALEAGYSSVMFDGSKLSIDENVKKITEIVKKAKECNASVEGEVGGIGGQEDGVISNGELACPEDCAKLAQTGIDMLAAGIGNIHGKYPDDWKGLNFDVLAKIEEVCKDLPLVLHGGSGIPEAMVKEAISHGVSKVNVNTELQVAFAFGVRKYIEEGHDLEGKGFDPRKLLALGSDKIKEVVKEKNQIFGSIGRIRK